MIPLTKKDTAYLLRCLCTRHNSSPSNMVTQIKQGGVQLTTGYILRYLDGVYFISTNKVAAEDKIFTILVDNEEVAYQSSRAGALVYADKLCQLLFTAREVRVEKDKTIITRWVRLPQYVNRWVQR